MNVGQLKAALAGMPEDAEITMQIQEEVTDQYGTYWASDYWDLVKLDYERDANTVFLMTDGED